MYQCGDRRVMYEWSAIKIADLPAVVKRYDLSALKEDILRSLHLQDGYHKAKQGLLLFAH